VLCPYRVALVIRYPAVRPRARLMTAMGFRVFAAAVVRTRRMAALSKRRNGSKGEARGNKQKCESRFGDFQGNILRSGGWMRELCAGRLRSYRCR
jgi:hypothetical protein